MTCTKGKIRTNWKQVDRELQLWRISDETIEAFEAGKTAARMKAKRDIKKELS